MEGFGGYVGLGLLIAILGIMGAVVYKKKKKAVAPTTTATPSAPATKPWWKRFFGWIWDKLKKLSQMIIPWGKPLAQRDAAKKAAKTVLKWAVIFGVLAYAYYLHDGNWYWLALLVVVAYYYVFDVGGNVGKGGYPIFLICSAAMVAILYFGMPAFLKARHKMQPQEHGQAVTQIRAFENRVELWSQHNSRIMGEFFQRLATRGQKEMYGQVVKSAVDQYCVDAMQNIMDASGGTWHNMPDELNRTDPRWCRQLCKVAHELLDYVEMGSCEGDRSKGQCGTVRMLDTLFPEYVKGDPGGLFDGAHNSIMVCDEKPGLLNNDPAAP